MLDFPLLWDDNFAGSYSSVMNKNMTSHVSSSCVLITLKFNDKN